MTQSRWNDVVYCTKSKRGCSSVEKWFRAAFHYRSDTKRAPKRKVCSLRATIRVWLAIITGSWSVSNDGFPLLVQPVHARF